jgi:hypothetical protein
MTKPKPKPKGQANQPLRITHQLALLRLALEPDTVVLELHALYERDQGYVSRETFPNDVYRFTLTRRGCQEVFMLAHELIERSMKMGRHD